MIDFLPRLKPCRDGGGDGACRVRTRMTIPRQTPIRIERRKRAWNVVCQYPLSNRTLDVVFGSELRSDHKRRRPAALSQTDDRPEDLTRHANAAFDCCLATKRNEQTSERHQPGFVLGMLPHEPWAEVRSIVVEVSAEQVGHENRNDRYGLTEARQLAREPQ